MINPPTECFYMMQLDGEAAEFAASTLSSSTTNDIKEAVLISSDFAHDIQALASLDEVLRLVEDKLDGLPLIKHEYTNPLYMPSTPDEIDSVFDGDIRSETMAFVGADGNPFTMKMIDVSTDERELVKARLTCKPFELPSYSEIIQEHKNLRLN